MTFTDLQAIWSVVVLATFIGIVWWAYSGKRASRFEEAANIPFNDTDQDLEKGHQQEKDDG